MHARSLDHTKSVATVICLPRTVETDGPVRRGYLVTSHAKLNMPAAVFVRLSAWLRAMKEKEKNTFLLFCVSGSSFCDVCGLT